MPEYATPEAVAERIPDGALIGVGGAGLQRKPLALLRALVAAGRQELRVVSVLGSLDVELLLAAGAVGELHSAGVSLDSAGLAPHYRAAREQGSVRFYEWSEGTLLCSLEATARGVPSIPTWMARESDLPVLNGRILPGSDPFTGEPVVHVRALRLDFALLHLPDVDALGYGYVTGDLAFDGALARAADEVIVSFESEQASDPPRAAL
jgi:glutaconate CoA-transferase subunit A